MRLVCIDLHDTLVDRDAAVRAWARGFVAEHGIDDDDAVDFVVAADGDGHVPEDRVFHALRVRFGLTSPVDELVGRFHAAYLDAVRLHDGVEDGLRALRDAGWMLAITTNGPRRQLDETARLGLDGLVDAVVTSALVGVRKPDPRIFEIAAERAGATLAGAWVVGDAPTHDISGAVRAELDSVWVSRGREWPEPGFRPTVQVDSFAEAVDVLLGRTASA